MENQQLAAIFEEMANILEIKGDNPFRIRSFRLPMLRLQGLGPRRINLIWKILRISTLDQLEAAAREQKLRHLPGMGEKTEATILKAVQEYRGMAGRFRLDQGLEVSQSLTTYLHTARRGWLMPNDVINTYPLEKLRRVLRKKEYR